MEAIKNVKLTNSNNISTATIPAIHPSYNIKNEYSNSGNINHKMMNHHILNNINYNHHYHHHHQTPNHLTNSNQFYSISDHNQNYIQFQNRLLNDHHHHNQHQHQHHHNLINQGQSNYFVKGELNEMNQMSFNSNGIINRINNQQFKFKYLNSLTTSPIEKYEPINHNNNNNNILPSNEQSLSSRKPNDLLLNHYYLNDTHLHSNNQNNLPQTHNLNFKQTQSFNNTTTTTTTTTTNNNNNNNKRPKSTYPFGKCKVCNDKATGVHYGIATCEGCKGFFKRSTLRKEKYRCFFGNNCPLTPDNRNRCKSCRFRKCLEVGMSIQGVKMGRIPKAEKERALMSLVDTADKMNNEPNEPSINGEYIDVGYDEDSNESSSEILKKDTNNRQNINADYYSPEEFSPDEDELSSNKLTSSKHQSNENINSSKLIEETDQDYNNNNNSKVSCYVNEQIYSLTDKKNLNDSEVSVEVSASKSSMELSHHLYNSLNISKNIDKIYNNDKNNKNDQDQQLISSQVAKCQILPKLSVSFIDLNQSLNNSDKSNTNSSTNSSDSNTSDSIIVYNRNKPECIQTRSIIDSKSQFSIFDLLQWHTPFKTSNIVANRFHSNFFPNNSNYLDDSYHIISSLLSDKIYQLFLEHNDKVDKLFDRAIKLINNGITEYDGCNASIQEVWDGLLESIPQCVKSLIAFSKEIPGINELSSKDLTILVNNRLFDYFIIKHSPLFINGESFMMLPNQIQYTRDWMLKIIGEEMVNSMFEFADEFNSLNMTSKEIALLFPFVLTAPDDSFKDPYTVANLNEYYYRALMYEFDLNRRTNLFVNRWKKLLAKLPELNELQAVKIGGLTPKC